MEDGVKRLARYVSSAWMNSIWSLPTSLLLRAHEIRIRADMPLIVSTDTESVKLPVFVTKEEVQACFLRLCGHAVHTHQDELAQGFVTTEDGFRVGVAGRAVIKDGRVVSYRDITSLCVRINRPMVACASPLMPLLTDGGSLHGLLVCGTPSCGKTTVLRDIARLLSVRYSVAIVDERRELAVSALSGCDILSGCLKAEGILQAVRTLAPDAVIADELGDDREWLAAVSSCYLGVPVMASVHASSIDELTARPVIRQALTNGAFDRVAILPPRHRVQEATEIWKARDLIENHGDRVDRVYLYGDRCGSSVAAEGSRRTVESVGTFASTIAQ